MEKTRLTPDELAKAHDGLCRVSIGDGSCSCLVHWVEALQKDADSVEADLKAAKFANLVLKERLRVLEIGECLCPTCGLRHGSSGGKAGF